MIIKLIVKRYPKAEYIINLKNCSLKTNEAFGRTKYELIISGEEILQLTYEEYVMFEKLMNPEQEIELEV